MSDIRTKPAGVIRELLIAAIHRGLGGDGWSYLNYGGNELESCREALVNAADAVMELLDLPDRDE